MEGVPEERTVARQRAIEAYARSTVILPSATSTVRVKRRKPRQLSAGEERWLAGMLEEPMTCRCLCGWTSGEMPARSAIEAAARHRSGCRVQQAA